MTALQLFHEGRLREALSLQSTLVSNDAATDPAERLLLAELCLFDGQFGAVRRHLEQLPRDRDGMDRYLESWSNLLDVESRRQRLLIEGTPAFLAEPGEGAIMRVNALEAIRDGHAVAAMEYLDEADACTPWTAGHVDGREFDGIRDTDDLYGPLLELIVDDQYVWFPAHQVRRLRMGKIESLRDLYFIPAWLTSRNLEEWPVYVPSLYAGSFAQADDDFRTGQATDWYAADDSPMRGIGLRMYHFGDEELSPLDFTQWEG